MTQGSGQASAKNDHAGVWVPPPLLFAVPFAIGLAIHGLVPVRLANLHGATLLAVGGAMVIAGVLLALSAVFTFAHHGTTILPARRTTTTVVTTGPYRLTRNPMYLGMAALYVGLAALLNSAWPMLLLPVSLIAVDRYAIRREEAYLSAKFGQPYDAFRQQVRRWL